MALINAIGKGGYTVVAVHQYIKSERHIGIELLTFNDSSYEGEPIRFEILARGGDQELSNADWDMWFGIDAIQGETTNLIKRCYEYLKSLPRFEDVVDA